MTRLSVNRLAMSVVQKMLDHSKELGLCVFTLDNGSTVVDAGKDAPGGFEAGRLIAEVSMGGLAQVTLLTDYSLGLPLLSVQVVTDQPLISCMLSQMAGWRIKVGSFHALGSGPARALAKVEKIYSRFPYGDDHDEAVLVLETSRVPGEEVAEWVCQRCGVDARDVYMLLTPTESVAGSTQICARVVESGMVKMDSMGIDISQIRSAYGACPVPPVCQDAMTMMGRTNDAILYGGSSTYVFEDGSDARKRIEEIPFSSSPGYGKSFLELLEAAGGEFYKIDAKLFSPSEVVVVDLSSATTAMAGSRNPVLLSSFLNLPSR